MRTVDRAVICAPRDRVFATAIEVERWPALLQHYRWVRMRERNASGGIVEMAAWRPFGPFRYPTWWVSEMTIDPDRWEIRYRHIDGITRGMDVVWRLHASPGGTTIELVHDWDGPDWPLIRRPAAEWIIGPVFVHGIASRTLAGIQRHLEDQHG